MLPDGTQKLLSICFEFLGPNAGQPAQLRQRFGARGGHLAQSGIVEDDVGRDLGFLGHFLAQGRQLFLLSRKLLLLLVSERHCQGRCRFDCFSKAESLGQVALAALFGGRLAATLCASPSP